MMSENDGREYARRGDLANWLEDFANKELSRNANPFEDIKNVFQQKNDANAVEARVQELRDRVGLDQIEKTASDKSQDNNAETILNLVALAGQLEKDGDFETATLIDNKIAELYEQYMLEDMTPIRDYMADDKKKKKDKKKKEEKKEKGVFEKFPAIKTFVDNLCHSRGGLIDMPAIMKMLNDERPEDIDTSDENLVKYIKDKLKSAKVDIKDDGDDVAGMDYTVFVVTEEDDGNSEVFDTPTRL